MDHPLSPRDTDTAPGAGSSDLPALLDAAVALAGRMDSAEEQCVRLRELRDRLAAGRFHLAVLGQFKRGKSTLLNALLGAPLLPTSVVPLTAIPTFVLPGPRPLLRIRWRDNRPPLEEPAPDAGALRALLERYVTEEGNPRNALGLAVAEVEYPGAALDGGVVWIDTPGIGSTHRHNTETTLNFLPRCDAAVVVLSADPPVTEAEAAFLRRVKQRVPRLVFVLNKIDYLSPGEADRAETFLRRVLISEGVLAPDAPLLRTAARRGLAARLAGDEAEWRASGLADLSAHLLDFLAREKATTLRRAVRGRAADTLRSLLLERRLRRQSLQLPLADLERRLAVFERKLAEIRLQRQEAADLLAGDSRRLHQALEERAAALRREARAWCEELVARSVPPGAPVDEATVQALLEREVPAWFEHQLGVLNTDTAARLREALDRHRRRADALVAEVRRTAADLFEIPHRKESSPAAYAEVRQPYWETHRWTTTLSPLPPGALDGLLPARWRRRRALGRLQRQVDAIVTTNVEKLRWAAYQNIDHALRRFTGRLDARLEQAVAATGGAVRATLARRHEQADTVEREERRLAGEIGELESLLARLEGAGR